MQRALVLDKNKNPLMPCHPARARQLLTRGKAAVFRQYPFTIILKERDGGDIQPITLKVDPGSKTTGIALVADFKLGKCVIWAGELTHRGQQIRDKLLSRRVKRRFRSRRPGINRAKCAVSISTAFHEPAPNKGAFTMVSKREIWSRRWSQKE